MALSEFEHKRLERIAGAFVDSRRPPPHIRSQLDLGFRIRGQSLEFFETRPQWDDPTIQSEHPVAKATYVKGRRIWRVFWLRADLRWHRYDPVPEVPSIEEFVRVVGEDRHHCFWG